MSWETAVVLGGLGVAGLFLWFATRQAENWFGMTMKVFFTILGLLALQATGASTLGMIDTANVTTLSQTCWDAGEYKEADCTRFSSANYDTLQGGSLAVYEILYYGVWVFISLFVIYYLYEIIMMLGNFIHRRRKKPFGEDGEEAE